jgi:hypothetical protein
LELTNGEMGNPWEQMLLVGAKKINVLPKKATELFSNGFFKEPLLNAPFNNGSKDKIIIKGSI